MKEAWEGLIYVFTAIIGSLFLYFLKVFMLVLILNWSYNQFLENKMSETLAGFLVTLILVGSLLVKTPEDKKK